MSPLPTRQETSPGSIHKSSPSGNTCGKHTGETSLIFAAFTRRGSIVFVTVSIFRQRNAFPLSGLLGCQWFSNFAMRSRSRLSLNSEHCAPVTDGLVANNLERKLTAELTSSFMSLCSRTILWIRVFLRWGRLSCVVSVSLQGVVNLPFLPRKRLPAEHDNWLSLFASAIYQTLERSRRRETLSYKNSNCVMGATALDQSECKANNESLVVKETWACFMTKAVEMHTCCLRQRSIVFEGLRARTDDTISRTNLLWIFWEQERASIWSC